MLFTPKFFKFYKSQFYIFYYPTSKQNRTNMKTDFETFYQTSLENIRVKTMLE